MYLLIYHYYRAVLYWFYQVKTDSLMSTGKVDVMVPSTDREKNYHSDFLHKQGRTCLSAVRRGRYRSCNPVTMSDMVDDFMCADEGDYDLVETIFITYVALLC